MYVRPTSHSRSGMKLPENYSGSAFSQQPIYNEMPPPTRTMPQRYQTSAFEPPISDIPKSEIIRENAPPSDIYEEPIYNEEYEEQNKEQPSAPVATSIFSSLLPKGGLGDHFPFGHGIGSEELLILAVMLMVFLSGNESGEIDSEFILLLGLLLFAG